MKKIIIGLICVVSFVYCDCDCCSTCRKLDEITKYENSLNADDPYFKCKEKIYDEVYHYCSTPRPCQTGKCGPFADHPVLINRCVIMQIYRRCAGK